MDIIEEFLSHNGVQGEGYMYHRITNHHFDDSVRTHIEGLTHLYAMLLMMDNIDFASDY